MVNKSWNKWLNKMVNPNPTLLVTKDTNDYLRTIKKTKIHKQE